MPNAIATMTTNAPKSGSSSSSPPTATITANSGRKPRSSVCFSALGVQERRLAHRVARRVQHDRELHELGRLEVDDDKRDPAPRAVDALADAGNEHQHQQHGADDEEPRREPLPDLHRHLERDDVAATSADADEQRVADEEVPRR